MKLNLNLISKTKIIVASFGILSLLWPSLPAHAAKGLILSASAVTIKPGEKVEIRVEIDTDGEKIGAVEFNMSFSTEVLEGLEPKRGNVCTTYIVESSTRYSCGKSGMDGFSGRGTIATFVYKGRAVGSTYIELRNFVARFWADWPGN